MKAMRLSIKWGEELGMEESDPAEYSSLLYFIPQTYRTFRRKE
jgi:hypothetical protein